MKQFLTVTFFLCLIVWFTAEVSRGEPNRNVGFVSEIHVSGDYQDVKVVGERIYCANMYGVVVWTFDENNPEQEPLEIARFATPGQANAIFIEDTLCDDLMLLL